jgi:hypothetical protein
LLVVIKNNPQLFCKDAFKERIREKVNLDGLTTHFGSLDWAQIERDLELFQKDAAPCGQAVRTLREWRNKVFAHRNKDASLDFEAFNKQWPLKQETIGELISKGFDILNRCAGWYVARSYSDLPCSRGEKDYLYVLDSILRAGPSQKNIYDLIAEFQDY